MQQPIKLSVGYAYIMSGEALICTVEDGQPSHAFTLTVDDLRALLAAFGEDAPPQPAPSISDDVIDTLLHVIDYYRENAFMMDGSLRDIELESAELWLKSLPSMPPPSVPLEVQQAIDSCLDILQTYHSGNPFLSDPVTSEMEIVRSWRDALSQPRDGESC